jgi:hypothetical protein
MRINCQLYADFATKQILVPLLHEGKYVKYKHNFIPKQIKCHTVLPINTTRIQFCIPILQSRLIMIPLANDVFYIMSLLKRVLFCKTNSIV